MNRNYVSSFRCLLVCSTLMLCFGVLFWRLYYLHIEQSERFTALAEVSRGRMDKLVARRGDIIDRRGNLLATTQTTVQVGVDPGALVPGDESRIPELARLLGVTPEFLREKFDQRYREVMTDQGSTLVAIRWHPLVDAIDEPAYEKVRQLGVRAIYGHRQYRRVYPGGSHASHLIGFLNRERQPSNGVEAHLDFYLRGQEGWRETERDGRRRELVQFQRREILPTPGMNVELSLDSAIQYAVERELSRLAETFQPKAATIIVSEAATGFVLALANYPDYDLNRFFESPVDHHRNRALTDQFEPGSTFKLVPVAAALDLGLVRPDDVFDCNVQHLQVRGRMARLPDDYRPMGELTVEEILVKSSNRGVAHLGVLMGDEALHRYASRFSFGEATGFRPGPEVPGTLHPPRAWDGLTITRLPMGHAVAATPMQVHVATSAIANGGVVMEPLLIRRIFDQQGETLTTFPPMPRRRAVSAETAQEISRMLAQVVGTTGTAQRAAIPGYGVAGKTGTTRKLINGRYSNQHHVASFSGFFPYHQPHLVITVVVDEPRIAGAGYGGLVAAPAFRNVAKECIRILGLPPVAEPPPAEPLTLGDGSAVRRTDLREPTRLTTILQ